MNSALQCLSCIPLLRDYFISGSYKQDINGNNSMKGRLAIEFGDLLTKLWKPSSICDYTSPDDFKLCVGKWAPQFRSYRFVKHKLNLKFSR